MAAVWRRAWRSKKVSSTGGGDGDGQPVFGSSTTTTATSGTRTTLTLSTSTYTAWSEPVREEEEEEEEERSAAELKQELVEARRHMMGLLEEFCAGADGNNAAAQKPVDRWLSELHVAWLLRPAEPELDASSSGQRVLVSRRGMQSWIRALQAISASVWRCLIGLRLDVEATVGAPPPLDAAPSEFAQFVKATLLKMFTFTHAIVALDPLNTGGGASGHQRHVFSSSGVVGTADKVRALLDVRHALSAASEQITSAFCFCPSPYVESTTATDYIRGFLSAQLGKLDEAVRDTIDHIRTAVILCLDADGGGSSSRRTTGTEPSLRSSPDIYNVTRYVMSYIDIVLSTKALLPANYHASHHGHTSCSLTTLTMEVVWHLEEELATASQSFSDQRLRFIFLINNSHFIWHQLHTSWPPHLHHDLKYQTFFDIITNRINRYIQSYLQLTWAPVLKSLMDAPKPSCFNRSSPLPKFHSKFQTTYATQKLWKVPDPELRKRLREAIIAKVIPGFTEYLEDNNWITPGVTPQELEKMLQELFEG